MIDYFFGKPRTGKTYRAVNYINDNYILSKDDPKYRNILTNIGGFNFKYINGIFRDKGSQSIAYKLVWKTFYEHLQVMYAMALDEYSDEQLNAYADKHNMNDCLIVLDEVSLYMKKYDDVISWWLAYHGHFRIRIILIAQSPKQINTDYLVHAEVYINAQPQSKQIANNQLKYIHYGEIYFTKENRFSSDTLKAKDEVYKLYKSGEVDKPKKVIYKFLFLMLLAFFVMIGMYKLLQYKLAPDKEKSQEISQAQAKNSDFSSTPEKIDHHKSYKSSNNEELVILRCDDRYCWNSDDKYFSKQIKREYLDFVSELLDISAMYEETSSEIYKLKYESRGQSKITLASFTDMYFKMDKSIKTDFFPMLFVERKDNFKASPSLSSTDISTFNPLSIN